MSSPKKSNKIAPKSKNAQQTGGKSKSAPSGSAKGAKSSAKDVKKSAKSSPEKSKSVSRSVSVSAKSVKPAKVNVPAKASITMGVAKKKSSQSAVKTAAGSQTSKMGAKTQVSQAAARKSVAVVTKSGSAKPAAAKVAAVKSVQPGQAAAGASKSGQRSAVIAPVKKSAVKQNVKAQAAGKTGAGSKPIQFEASKKPTVTQNTKAKTSAPASPAKVAERPVLKSVPAAKSGSGVKQAAKSGVKEAAAAVVSKPASAVKPASEVKASAAAAKAPVAVPVAPAKPPLASKPVIAVKPVIAAKPAGKSRLAVEAKPAAVARPAVMVKPAAVYVPGNSTALKAAPRPAASAQAAPSSPAPSAPRPAPAAAALAAPISNGVRTNPPYRPAVTPAMARPVTKPGVPHAGFKAGDYIVYPAHGVGQIAAIEEQEVAGFKLELFVVDFVKDKMTLKVPMPKVLAGAIRKLSSPESVKKALETLTGRARIKRTMWSRRAQEYEAKINSGDLVTIAEVVRDLYRSEVQPEQSYSERQLYEAAVDRMAREVAVIQKLTDAESLKVIEQYLQRGPRRPAKGEAETGAGEDAVVAVGEAA